jgi:hypothetical protein
MSHKGKATSDVSFNPEDPLEVYTSESAYKKVTEYHEVARAMYGPNYDPTTDNIDARLVMCLGKRKQHGCYWMANSVIDSATTPTLSQIRAQTTSGSGLLLIRERSAYGQARVEALQVSFGLLVVHYTGISFSFTNITFATMYRPRWKL